jgi:hypothetical protein
MRGSIYEGTETEQSYAQGSNHGRAAGEHDREHYPALVPAVIGSAKMNALVAYRRPSRAYHLGYLRGYREAVR